MNIVGIITARGGSKRLPGKNIKPLAGKPLIAYSIEAGLKAGLNGVYVTSDSQEILDIAKGYGATPILRPPELATSEATSQVAVRHALENIGANASDYLMLLQPTSPLRTADDITRAIALYERAKPASLVAVCETDTRHAKKLIIRDGFLEPAGDAASDLYCINGAIYLLGIKTFLKHDSFFVPPVLPYVMDKKRSVDIDEPADFTRAENILLGKN